jgi:hypothetical protein
MGRRKIHIFLIISVIFHFFSTDGLGNATENIDPANDGSQYAYAENAGWLNSEPRGDGGPGIRVQTERLTGWIWSENLGWISLACENHGSGFCNSVSNYGVNRDSNGNLTGYAWGENVGWISFSCSDTGSCGKNRYGISIDPTSGNFAGYAWGENIGWINFSQKVGFRTRTIGLSGPGGGTPPPAQNSGGGGGCFIEALLD